MTTLPPGMYPPPQQPLYAQQLLPGWEQRTQGHNAGAGGGSSGSGGGQGGDGPFAAAFDFSFSTYASVELVKMMYIIFIVLIGLAYLGEAVLMFVMLPPIGIAVLLLGWIPALLVILAIRVGLEATLATVRTAIDTRALRARYVGPVTE